MAKTPKKPAAKQTKKRGSAVEQVTAELETKTAELNTALENLEVVNQFFAEVEKFSQVVLNAKSELRQLNKQEFELKEQLDDVKSHINSCKNLIDSSQEGMLAIVEPGPANFMPLFDRMETTDPKVHGKKASSFRERPMTVLRLSPLAAQALIAAEIVFIGQLQDLIIASPDDWWETVEGLTEAIAAAVADKLNDFVKKGGE